MKKYLILIHGHNYLFKEKGQTVKKGFYVTRCVEARDQKSAEESAIKMLREDESLAKIVNDEDDSPWMSVEQIGEVDAWEELRPPGSGFAFYQESTSTPDAELKN